MYCSPENVSLSAEDCLAMKKDMRNTNYSVYIEKIAVQQKWIFVTLNCQQQGFKKSREKPHNKVPKINSTVLQSRAGRRKRSCIKNNLPFLQTIMFA